MTLDFAAIWTMSVKTIMSNPLLKLVLLIRLNYWCRKPAPIIYLRP